MIKRIIAIVVWALLTIFYAWNIADIGRSMGANTTSSIEFHLEAYNDTLTSVFSGEEDYQTALNGIINEYIESKFHDLSKEYKKDFTAIGAFSIIYIIATLICYDMVFIKPKFERLMDLKITTPTQEQRE